MTCTSRTTGAHQAGCSKRPSSKAAGESKPEAYPLGYVEDFDEPRTLLADFFSTLLVKDRLSAHREHYAESCLAAQHTIIGGSGLFEREGLDHGTNAGQGAEVQRVFRIPGGSGRPTLNRPAGADELNGRDSNGVG